MNLLQKTKLNTLGAAVVGTGYLGTFHAEKYSSLDGVQLIAVCDADSEKATKVAKKLKTKVANSYKDLPEMGVVCASVSSDTKTHYEITKYLLENGIDVLVEKPMTTTIEEASELIAIAAKYERILQVGHLERFNPAFTRMRDFLTKPWFFEVRRITPFRGRGADVDVILDLMIHDIDLVLNLTKEEIVKVEAVGIPILTDSIDIAQARLEFASGAIANISTSRAAFQSERSFRVFQPDRYLSLDLEKKKLKMAEKGVGKNLLGFPNVNLVEEKIDIRDALFDQLKAFTDAVRDRSAPQVSGEDGLRALKIVQQVKDSILKSTSRLSEISGPVL